MKPHNNKEEEKKHQPHTNPDQKKHQDKNSWQNPKKDGGCGPCGSCDK